MKIFKKHEYTTDAGANWFYRNIGDLENLFKANGVKFTYTDDGRRVQIVWRATRRQADNIFGALAYLW
jgi:hypothetical protein